MNERTKNRIPEAGYYQCTIDIGEGHHIVLCSGDTKGNKYWREIHGKRMPSTTWVNLLWTCLPTNKDIQAGDYVKIDTLPSGVPEPPLEVK